MKILRNDEVLVLTGKDKGKRGRVRLVMPKDGRVVVENVNIHKRHLKRGRARQTGIIEFEAPLEVSNVMVVCTSCGEPTRIGYEVQESGDKVRVCKRCQQVIERRVMS